MRSSTQFKFFISAKRLIFDFLFAIHIYSQHLLYFPYNYTNNFVYFSCASQHVQSLSLSLARSVCCCSGVVVRWCSPIYVALYVLWISCTSIKRARASTNNTIALSLRSVAFVVLISTYCRWLMDGLAGI